MSDIKYKGKPLRYGKSLMQDSPSISLSEPLVELYEKNACFGCPICAGKFSRYYYTDEYYTGKWIFNYKHDDGCQRSTREWQRMHPDEKFPKSDKPKCMGTCCGTRWINQDTGYIHWECTPDCPFRYLPEDTLNDGAVCIICERKIFQNNCLDNNSIHTVECPYYKAQINNWPQNAIEEPIIPDQPYTSKTDSGIWYVIIPGKDNVNLPEDANPIENGFHGDDSKDIPIEVLKEFNKALDEWFEYKKNEEKKIQDNAN